MGNTKQASNHRALVRGPHPSGCWGKGSRLRRPPQGHLVKEADFQLVHGVLFLSRTELGLWDLRILKSFIGIEFTTMKFLVWSTRFNVTYGVVYPSDPRTLP